MRTAIDVFAGLGGFSLAAQANGVEVIAQVEIDERCRAFLKHHWGDIQHGDIRDFDGTKYLGQCWLLAGGPPCQPASRAGKQRGEADDRWLWPEAIRVLREVQPTWCLYENPPGIGDMDFAGILAEMEGCGYETRVFNLPACAVNSPQRRERYWIVAHSDSRPWQANISRKPVARQIRAEIRNEYLPSSQRTMAYSKHSDQPDSISSRARRGACTCLESAESRQDDVADTATTRLEGAERRELCKSELTHGYQNSLADTGSAGYKGADTESRQDGLHTEYSQGQHWQDYVWVPCGDSKFRRAIGSTQRVAHGLPVELLETLGTEGRQTPEDCKVTRSLLAALGNAIVPQLATQIIAAMTRTEEV